MSVGTLLLIADQFNVPASTLLPPAHQSDNEPVSPHVEHEEPGLAVLMNLPDLEAGAIMSIVQVLAARPDLILPIMNLIEQAALDHTKR